VLVVLGCNSQRPPPVPARFEQPNAVDFVCTKAGLVVPLGECKLNFTDEDDYVPYAVVTQHSRGEIAVVDLEAHKVIDSRRDIPGYTFTAVGELPIAVVIPPRHPDFTYVADFGSRDIRVLKTSTLVLPLTTTLGEAPEVQIVPLSVTTAQGSTALAPTQMALAPDENALIVAVPEQGNVLWFPLERCAAGAAKGCVDGRIDVANMTTIKLDASAGLVQPVTGPAPRNEYERLCDYERPEPPPAKPIELAPDAFAHAPRPSGFAIDSFCFGNSKCPRRLLVSDEAQPIIHVIDVDKVQPGVHGSDALLPPIVTGVPTRGVTVTPRVPKKIDNDQATQYVYAIDATDGSVLVTENGHVLTLDGPPAQRPDRIQFDQQLSVGAPAATTLTMLTPHYHTDEPVGQWVDPNTAAQPDATKCLDPDHELENPARLRGVFLAVAMTDGTVRIVDVHDMELHKATLKGMTDKDGNPIMGSCRQCPTNPIPAVIRHHERLASNFIVDPGEDLPTLTPSVVTFEFEAEGLPFPVRDDGSSGSPDATGLTCFKCNSAFTRVFPQTEASTTATSSGTGGTGTTSSGTGTGGTGTTTVASEDDAGVAEGEGEGACVAPEALLCAPNDPWTLSQEGWVATYEGHLPATTGGDGRFLDPDPSIDRPVPELAGSVDFCAAGVIGEDIFPQVYTGEDCDAPFDMMHPPSDQVVITASIPSDDLLEKYFDVKNGKPTTEQAIKIKTCSDARAAIDDDPTLTFAFKVRRAYRDRLMIGAELLQPIGALRNYQQLRDCLGATPMTFDVRARNAFVLIGSQHGFQHRITADSSGRCVVDHQADPLQRARVRLGCTFRNQSIEWHALKPRPEERVQEPPAGLQLSIQVLTPAVKLQVNAGSVGFGGATVVPTQLRYNWVDEQLYLVDISDRGLVPITLDPVPAAVDPTAAFN
jgi:hypothetical protein